MNSKRLHIYVSGKVQGVGYRAFLLDKAKSLDIVGWAKNLDDGRVEIIVEGSEDKLGEFLNYVTTGSKASNVEDVQVDELSPTGEFSSFLIQ